MRWHNLGTVLGFEVRRTLTRPSFWLTSLSVPALMVVIVALMWFSNASSAASVEAQSEQGVPFTYTDASGIVEEDVAARLGGTATTDAAGAAQAVREGRSDLHLDIPADPASDPVRAVGADRGIIASGQWSAIARTLLQASATERIDDRTLTSVLAGVAVTTELWKDGEQSPGLAAAVVPGLFLVLLYMGVLMLGQQMLNITVEEKENRVTEMILTTIDTRVLLVGKILAVFIVGIVQACVLLVPGAVAVLAVPSLTGATSPADAAAGLRVFGETIVVDPVRILLAAGLFTGGFLLFTGLLVAIGSVMPTAKDAGSAFGAVILAMFLPLYAATLIVTEPDGVVARVLTWFPLTAPVTALLLNALGALSVPVAVGVTAVLLACAAGLLWVGVRLFRQGSIAYDRRLAWSKVLGLLGRGRAARR